jgi:hypothetical protein
VFDIDLLCDFVTHRIGAKILTQSLTIVHDPYVLEIPKERIGWLRERLEIHEMFPTTTLADYERFKG